MENVWQIWILGKSQNPYQRIRQIHNELSVADLCNVSKYFRYKLSNCNLNPKHFEPNMSSDNPQFYLRCMLCLFAFRGAPDFKSGRILWILLIRHSARFYDKSGRFYRILNKKALNFFKCFFMCAENNGRIPYHAYYNI